MKTSTLFRRKALALSALFLFVLSQTSPGAAAENNRGSAGAKSGARAEKSRPQPPAAPGGAQSRNGKAIGTKPPGSARPSPVAAPSAAHRPSSAAPAAPGPSAAASAPSSAAKPKAPANAYVVSADGELGGGIYGAKGRTPTERSQRTGNVVVEPVDGKFGPTTEIKPAASGSPAASAKAPDSAPAEKPAGGSK